MSIQERTTYYVVCDICEDSDGDSRPTREEAIEHGTIWEVIGTAGTLNGRQHACDECCIGLGTI